MRRSLARIRHRRRLPMPPEASPAESRPAVSVVIATYNRSNVLVHAVDSVRRQTVEDWELIVVGDACTDDTAQVVRAIGDPRIRFLDLRRNFGDQSGPNSVGMRLARGARIAWLNHDDLWYPDHLEQLIRVADTAGAQVAIAPAYRVRSLVREADGWAGVVELPAPSDRFDLVGGTGYQASRWLMDAGLVHRLGDWKSATRMRYTASQEYLYRAWSAGASFALAPTRSVVIIPSIVGGGSYSARRDSEQTLVRDAVAAGDRTPFESIGIVLPSEPIPPLGMSLPEPSPSALRAWLRARAAPIYHRSWAVVVRLGIAPWEYAGFLMGVPRGGTNALLRQRRGLA